MKRSGRPRGRSTEQTDGTRVGRRRLEFWPSWGVMGHPPRERGENERDKLCLRLRIAKKWRMLDVPLLPSEANLLNIGWRRLLQTALCKCRISVYSGIHAGYLINQIEFDRSVRYVVGHICTVPRGRFSGRGYGPVRTTTVGKFSLLGAPVPSCQYGQLYCIVHRHWPEVL
jgi:hypothetical protein